ncbi:hypothetical protein L1049_004869 [Liquidambar formosana]|uniref:AtPDCT1/2 transmembrane domain-containing protein n=1 Tax=Liquidambar formosana TaxID=63359 RepID=A0AAP0RU43_LIQFO
MLISGNSDGHGRKGASPSSINTTLKNRSKSNFNGRPTNGVKAWETVGEMAKKTVAGGGGGGGFLGKAYFMKWSMEDVVGLVRNHPIPCVFGCLLLFFMGVEYTLPMIPPSSPPFDLGFVVTRPIHSLLASSPALNTLFAALNTVFVGMQTIYILWTWLVEGRPRATISALFMFTCRGILGYTTQLPLPQGFLGSGMDFPVGNVSFFLFFSGHVAGSVIASLDMRRMERWKLAWTFEHPQHFAMPKVVGYKGSLHNRLGRWRWCRNYI